MGSKRKREILGGETYGAVMYVDQSRLRHSVAFSAADCDGADAVPPSFAGLDDQTTRAFGGATRRCGCGVH